jgi:hypothetical protein
MGNCDICTGGKVDCYTCSGTGSRDGEVCSDCGGSGKKTCPRCHGSGSIPNAETTWDQF